MSFHELSDDVALASDHTPAPDRTAVSIRQSIATVESSLTEFDKIVAGLEVLHREHPIDLVFDVSTTKGMAEAVAHRAAWRTPRIAVEKFRTTAKQPVLKLGKDIDARAAWITEQLLEGETPVHEQIKAEEARKAKERADREAAEFGRVTAMQEAIGELAMSAMVNGLPSIAIAARLESLRIEPLDPKVYQEMMPQAQAARTAAIAKLEQGLKAAQWDEAEAKRKAEEAERLRAEQAAADAERARVSAEQAAEAKRLADAAAALAEQDRARKQAEAEFAAKVAAFEAQQLAAAEAVKLVPEPAPELPEGRDSQHVLKAEAETPDATDREIPVTASPSVGSMGAGQPADAGAAVESADTRPPINAGDICKRLGFVLTVEFIESTLGIPHESTVKRSTFWPESAWPAIKAALVKHIEALA